MSEQSTIADYTTPEVLKSISNKWAYLPQRISHNIVVLRKARSLSQEELSMLAHMDRTYLARIEENKSNPSIEILIRIGKALKVSPENFFLKGGEKL